MAQPDEDNLGFIKIHRKILKWEWYADVNVVKLFLHCLILANHKPKNWRGFTIERGEFISSLGNLAKGCGLTVQQIRTAMNKLKSTNEVTSKATNKFTMITVTNYATYHVNEKESNKQDNKRVTNEQQTSNKQVTTTKNVKNVKNVKNKDIYLDFVKLTKEEYKKLEKKFGKKNAEQRIWTLNDYGHRKKKKFNEYTDHYRTILNWERRENGKNNQSSKRKPVTKAQSKSTVQTDCPTVITIED